MWREEKGRTFFLPGQDAPEEAARAAAACKDFRRDYEEECFEEEEISCYNCRYRRWTADTFECMKRREK